MLKSIVSVCFLNFFAVCSYAQTQNCADFLEKEVKPMEFRMAKVLQKFEKNGVSYLKLQKFRSEETFEFTLQNLDKSGVMKKAKIGNFLTKEKDSLKMRISVITFEGERAISETFQDYTLKCK